ncbi:MAG: hypothetical protein ACTSPI_16435, partial [Candidatus Heimdallarchaeaceae archaeon]
MVVINTRIEPLIAILCYKMDSGRLEFEQIETGVVSELEDLTRYFKHISYDFLQWVKKYNEITIFRGSFRATYFKVFNMLLLFVSRFENTGIEIRPVIKNFIKELGLNIIDSYISGTILTDTSKIFKEIMKMDVEDVQREIIKIFSRLEIDIPECVYQLKQEKVIIHPSIEQTELLRAKEIKTNILKEYESSKQFELV